MSAFEQADEAARFVAARSALRPTVGLVLGSGLGAFADSLGEAVRIPYGEIPYFPRSTAVGHSGQLVIGLSRGTPLAVMAGRVHCYEGYSLPQVVLPVRALGRLGVKVLVLTNAAGSVNALYQPGDLMVIENHVNFMGGNPVTGPNDERLGPRFFDLSEPYDAELRALARRICAGAGRTVRPGVYIAFSGPSFETPAEIRMSRGMGADAVGMSTVPEVIAARHMGLRVLGLSCITNMAAGLLNQPLDHLEVLEMGERMKPRLMEALAGIVQAAVQA